MAKLYKVEMYILDVNENYSGLDEIVQDAELSTDVSINCFNKDVVDVEWDDDIDINYSNCPVEVYRKYFKEKK